MGTVSRNFDYAEFEASGLARKNKIINIITDARVRDSVKALVLSVLQPLRDSWGLPLHINSGYRCPELNEQPEIHGSSTSQHVKGEAADVACTEPWQLAQLAYNLDLPYDQMIVYPTFVHFSHKLEGPQRRQILYNKSYKGRKVDL